MLYETMAYLNHRDETEHNMAQDLATEDRLALEHAYGESEMEYWPWYADSPSVDVNS